MEVLDDFYNTVCCEITPHYPDPYSFNFDTQHPHENKERFQSNTIKTTKYNVANFFPSNSSIYSEAILNQYKRIANLYFLAVAVMSTIPGVTPLNPALIWLPLGVVLVVSLIKEGTFLQTKPMRITNGVRSTSKSTQWTKRVSCVENNSPNYLGATLL